MPLGLRIALDIFHAAAGGAQPTIDSPVRPAQVFPGALDQFEAFVRGSGLDADGLAALTGKLSQAECRLRVDSAAALLTSLTKTAARRPTDRSTQARLGSARKHLVTALDPEVLVNASDAALQRLDAAIRTFKETMDPVVAGLEKVPGALEDFMEVVASGHRDGPPVVRHPIDLVVPDDGDLSALEIPEGTPAVRLIHEGPLAPETVAALGPLALRVDGPVQAVDLASETVVHVWADVKRQVYTDDAELARRGDLGGGAIGNADTLSEALRKAPTGEVHLVATGEGEALDATVLQLLSQVVSDGTDASRISITDGANNPLLTVQKMDQGLRIRASNGIDAEKAQALISDAIDRPEIQELSFGGAGLVRTGDDVDLRLPSDRGLTKAGFAAIPILAHRLENTLDKKIDRASLEPLVAAMLDQVTNSADASTQFFDRPSIWNEALDGMAYLMKAPACAPALQETVGFLLERSELPDHRGFGCPSFSGHALGENALALIGLFRQGQIEDWDQALRSVLQLRDAPGPKVFGAVLPILFDRRLSHDPVRKDSAKVELDKLAQLQKGFANSGDQEVRIGVLPTDRTHGQANTATPDFLVQRVNGKRFDHLFVDAKSKDAKFFDAKDKSTLEGGFRQLTTHAFLQSDTSRRGMVMLELYNVGRGEEQSLLEDLQRQAVELASRDETPVFLHVNVRGGGRSTQVLMGPPDYQPEAVEDLARQTA